MEKVQKQKKKSPRRGIEPRSTTRQAVILATKLSRIFVKLFSVGVGYNGFEKKLMIVLNLFYQEREVFSIPLLI